MNTDAIEKTFEAGQTVCWTSGSGKAKGTIHQLSEGPIELKNDDGTVETKTGTSGDRACIINQSTGGQVLLLESELAYELPLNF